MRTAYRYGSWPALLAGFLLFLVTADGTAAEKKGSVEIEGVVTIGAGTGATVEINGRKVRLESEDREIRNTLQDPRISGRTLVLEGLYRNPDTFLVDSFLVRRPDALYRLIYFCDT